MLWRRGVIMEKYTAVIPVRESREGQLNDKDLLPFGNGNLLTHKINQLKKLKDVKILVTTESDRLKQIATEQEIEVLMRPNELSQAEASFDELVKYVVKNVATEHIMWCCVTSPLFDENNFAEAITLYEQAKADGFDSLISVKKLQRYILDKNGALNYRIGKHIKNISQLPLLYIFTNGVSIAARNDMEKWGYTQGNLPYLYEIEKPNAIDICDEYDYQCACFFYKQRINK